MSVVEDRVCVKYEIGYKSEDMEKVKLTQEFDDQTKRSRETPVFSGKEGAEGLIYVYKRFKTTAKYLSFDEGVELFDNFGLCLKSTAEENWATLTDEIDDDDKTPEFFEECFHEFLLKYCTHDARDLLIDYLKSPSCKKPHNTDVREHGERIRTLCVLANSLPGSMPELDDATRKKILFDTFPQGWILDFYKVRQLAESTEQQIMDFMCIQKTTADQRERKRGFGGRGGGPPTQRGRFGGRSAGRGFGMNGRGNGGRGNFNNGGRNYFSGFQRSFNNNGYNNNGYRHGNGGNGNGSYGNTNNNGHGGRFQNRFQHNNNFNRGRLPAGRAPMGRAPAASQQGNFMIQGREPMDGRANGNNGSRTQGSSTQQQHYFYDNEEQQYDDGNDYDDGNWQQEYGGYDNFYTDYDESQAGW